MRSLLLRLALVGAAWELRRGETRADPRGLGRASQAEGKTRVKAQRPEDAGVGARETGWRSLSGRCRLEDEHEKGNLGRWGTQAEFGLDPINQQ